MAVIDRPLTRGSRRVSQLLASGWFEAVTAMLLLLLAIFLNRAASQPLGVLLLDAALCVTAGLSARRPRILGVVLGTLLALNLLLPVHWATLGEYAPLIPIAGSGMRGRVRVQRAMIAGYGLLLGLITIQDAPSVLGAAMGCLSWAALIFLAWVVGRAFIAHTRAQQQQREAEATLHQQQLARDLHDTVARSLTVVVRVGERLRRQAAFDSNDLHVLTDAARAAHDQLRLVMQVLRDPATPNPPVTGAASLVEALRNGMVTLRQHGFAPTITIEGNVGCLTELQSTALGAAAGEAFANVVKHGETRRPVAVVVLVTQAQIDLTVLNYAPSRPGTTAAGGMGLWGMQQRVAEVGGTVTAEPSGAQWQTRVRIPLLPSNQRPRVTR